MTPALIVTNARIATGDPRRPWATALAVTHAPGDAAGEGEILAAVGSAAEILKMAGAETRVIDAGGQSIVLPAGMAIGAHVRVAVDEAGTVAIVPAVRDLFGNP